MQSDGSPEGGGDDGSSASSATAPSGRRRDGRRSSSIDIPEMPSRAPSAASELLLQALQRGVSLGAATAATTASSDDLFVLVEANLVSEREEGDEPQAAAESAPAPILVVARPIRRRRQAACAGLAALGMVAVVAGVVLGMMGRPGRPLPPPPPRAPTEMPTPAPTASPTSSLELLFRPTLPPRTIERLGNASSPQRRAFEWAVHQDRVPLRGRAASSSSPQDDGPLLRRMRQRFALAALYFGTGGGDGGSGWRRSDGWLNATLDECEGWEGVSCTRIPEAAGAAPAGDGSSDGGGWVLDELDLGFNDLGQSLPREIGLLTTLSYLDL
jgi:hypothetical protein